MSDILMKGTEPIGQVADLTADNVEYSSGVSVKQKIDNLLEVKTVEKTYTTDQYGHFSFGSEFNNGLNVIRVFALERQANRFVQLYTWNGNTIGLLTDGANSMANETNKYRVIYFE